MKSFLWLWLARSFVVMLMMQGQGEFVCFHLDLSNLIKSKGLGRNFDQIDGRFAP